MKWERSGIENEQKRKVLGSDSAQEYA